MTPMTHTRPRRPFVHWLLAAAGAVLFGAAQPSVEPQQPAQPVADQSEEPSEAEIILRDGKRISGLLVNQNKDQVVISIAGIETTFSMEVVDRIRILPPVQERYEALRETFDPEDIEGRLRLAEWVRSKGRLDLALREIEEVLALEPNNPHAKDLQNLVLAQQAVANQKVYPREDRPPPPGKPSNFPLLTKEQINLIRVFEVDLKNPPRMLIERATVERFLDKYGGTVVEGRGPIPVTPNGRQLFLRMKPEEVLSWMFDLKAREFYPEVTVLENPRSLQMFRDTINRNWLVNSCATNRCHGGEEAGRLWLYNRQQASDPAAYTNFLILERFRLSTGQPLINYNEPARSPLLHMGLPRDQAIFKHPEVTGRGRGPWTPTFRSQEDYRFVQAVEWIKSMYPKRPDYPIDYQPPVPKPKIPQGLGPDGQPVDR
jgi:hypothetical protein